MIEGYAAALHLPIDTRSLHARAVEWSVTRSGGRFGPMWRWQDRPGPGWGFGGEAGTE